MPEIIGYLQHAIRGNRCGALVVTNCV